MPSFEIVKAEFKKSFEGKQGGEFAVYTVELKDGEGYQTVEMVQKSATPAPTAGQTVEGTIEHTQYGSKFKKAQAFGGGGGKSFGKSPEESARIARMNSHAHALKYWELKHASDPAFGFASWGDYTKVVDLFFNDVQGTKA